MPGRPKKKRKRAPDEEAKTGTKLGRAGLLMTCQRCQQISHNQRTCKNTPVELPAKRNRGRPKKINVAPDASTNVFPSASTDAAPNAYVSGSGVKPNRKPSGRQSQRHKLPFRKANPSNEPSGSQQSSVSKERAKVRQGVGVRVVEETGNIYMKMPSDRRVKMVHTPAQAAQAAQATQGAHASKRGK